jgi:hypothetical protein
MGTGIIMFFPIPTRCYFRKDDCRCELEMGHDGDHDVECRVLILESINLIGHQMRTCH